MGRQLVIVVIAFVILKSAHMRENPGLGYVGIISNKPELHMTPLMLRSTLPARRGDTTPPRATCSTAAPPIET